ncbi:MAG: DUF6069 family protein [Actinomycetota bacterium]|nr:DUF6069 family protein [Actinomycetota bacterium]
MPVSDPTPRTPSPSARRASRRPRPLRRALAVASAPAAATALWALEVPLAGVRLAVHFGPSAEVVGIGPVIGASVVASLAGWAALELAERRSAHPRRDWSILAAVVATLSLALPIAAATTALGMLGLIGLHLAVAASVIPQMRSTAVVAASPVAGAAAPSGSARRWSGLSRTAALLVAAAVVGGGAFAAVTGASFASTLGRPAGGPFGLAAQFGPMRGFGTSASGPGGWGGGPFGWSRPSSADEETFQVASTNPAGPGSIIITGVVDAGGVEHPGRAIDGASFAGGSFRIDHASGHPTERFDPTTCVGTISQDGSFEVIDGTGRFSHLSGTGHYVFRATYTTARGSTGCGTATTAYIEQIDGVVGLSPSVARSLAAAQG